MRGSYILSWKPCQGDSSKLNLLDHRYKRWCCSLIPVESDSLLRAHAQTTKTYYKHQERSSLKTKTSATLIFKIFLKDIKTLKTKIVKGDCSAFQTKILLNLTQSEQVLHSLRKLFKTTSFDHSSSSEFKLFDHEGHLEEGITKTMMEPTMEEYMMRIPRGELHEHNFSESENEDANEHIERVLKIVDLFTTPDVTQD
ncbi:hypothetical protein Tco_0054481 [Tanacetum coccineum]